MITQAGDEAQVYRADVMDESQMHPHTSAQESSGWLPGAELDPGIPRPGDVHAVWWTCMRTLSWCLVLLGLLSSGCQPPPLPLMRLPAQPAAPPQSADGVLVAGLGKVDLTPPPGLPLFGYAGARSSDAAGVRTRLYARAWYLEDAQGARLALVQCDLGAISALLHLQVARAIVQETGISVDRLLLSATHTHAGPGGYFGDVFANHWGASRPGYEPRLVTFLTQRIAEAVLTAYRSRLPARLAIAQSQVYGLTTNRSLVAYTANPARQVADATLSTVLPQYLAVDPTLTLLRIDRLIDGKFQPSGAWSNFAIHGTALPPSNDLYSGDVHAAAARGLEWAIQRHYRVTGAVIHALTNGSVGDVAPVVAAPDAEEAEQLGIALAARAFELFQQLDGQLTDQVQLSHHYEEISLRTPRSVDDLPVCPQALLGAPVLGGSEEGRTTMYGMPLGAYEGARLETPSGCQTWKRPALGPLQGLQHATDFPRTLALQVLRIHTLLLLAVPGELTTDMGRRVKEVALQVAQSHQPGVTQVAIVGLANQYAGYFTTPEEYALQHYEGALTLHGPASGLLILSRFIRLLEQMATPAGPVVLPKQWQFQPGPKLQAFPEAKAMRGARVAEPVSVELNATPPQVRFRWQDLGPGAIELDAPLVFVQMQERDGRWVPLVLQEVPVNDQGLRLEIRYLQDVPATGAGLWQTTWYLQGEVNTPLRFAIAARGVHPVLYSEPFRLQ